MVEPSNQTESPVADSAADDGSGTVGAIAPPADARPCSCRGEVCFLVFNAFVRDARVLREAKTLVAEGYGVTVVATSDPARPEREEVEGIRVLRLALTPLHQRVFAPPAKAAPATVPLPTLPPLAAGTPPGAAAVAARPPMSRTRRWFVKSWRRWFSTPPPAPMKQLRRQVKLRVTTPAGRLHRKIARGSRRLARRAARGALGPFGRELRYFDYYQRAVAAYRAQRCDVVHAHDLNVLPAAFWLARSHRARLVFDSHELYLDRNRRPPRTWWNRFLVRQLERFLIRRCDAVITVNESIARLLAQRYRVPTPVVVMNTPAGTGIATVAPPLRALLPIDPGHRVLIYCGFLTFHRGLPNLIRSLHHLPSCHLVLMGFGVEKYVAELDEIAQSEGVGARYSRLAAVPPEQVSSYAAGADLGVAPIENACLSYYYCAPNKLFEYLHAGLPVIASDFPELRAVIERHRIGDTFDPADPRDIARAALQVLDADADSLAAMRGRARVAAASYNWERESEKLLQVYRGFAAGAAGSQTAISPGPRLAQAK